MSHSPCTQWLTAIRSTVRAGRGEIKAAEAEAAEAVHRAVHQIGETAADTGTAAEITATTTSAVRGAEGMVDPEGRSTWAHGRLPRMVMVM